MSEWRFPNQATPVGSPVYYAVRFSAPAQHDRYALLLAWFDLIDHCAANPVDAGVARVKLDWWRNELARLGDGRPSHPLAVEMQAAGLHADGLLRHLRTLVDAADDEIMARHAVSDQAFTEHCRRAGGARFLALGAAAASSAAANGLRDAGALCEALERIRATATAPRRVPPSLRTDALKRLADAERVAHIEGMLQPLAGADPESVRRHLTDVTARLTLLGLALQRKMRGLAYAVHAVPIDRAPIANLWTAWRC